MATAMHRLSPSAAAPCARPSRQRGEVITRLEKLRSEEQQVEAARGALLAQRDAAILQLRQGVLEVAGRLSTRTLRPKKTDVELSGLTLAWGAEPVG
jgi:hypothetical protein